MKKLRLRRSSADTSAIEPKPKTKRGAKLAVLPTGRRLSMRSWRDYRAHWKPYMKIVALVLVPVNVLSVFAALANDAGFNAYSTMAALIMTVALGWTMVQVAAGRGTPTMKQAYYEGTAAFVRYTLVLLWLLLMVIPAGVGAVIFLVAATPPPGVLVTASDAALIDLIALVFALPSIWLLTRFSLAPFAVLVDGKTPWEALKHSRRLTLGRFWQTLARSLFMGLVLALLGVVLYLPVAALGLVFHQSGILSSLFALLVTLTVWPFASLYLLKLYRELSALKAAA